MEHSNNNKKEIWITVEMGDGARRNMPKSKWPLAQENSRWLIELAIKAGYSREEAEKHFSVWIADEYELDCDE